MRFDDSLKTVLAADTSTAFGAQSAFRQLVDLLGRRRIPLDTALIGRLRSLRPLVAPETRAACARALALAVPEAALVAFFAEDQPGIVAPLLRGVTLTPQDWTELLPGIGPSGRAILRQRRDLPEAVARGLDTFGSVDFSLAGPIAPRPDEAQPAGEAVIQPTAPARGTGPFVALGTVARNIPVVAEALRQAGEGGRRANSPGEPQRFEISDLVARIAAYQKHREPPVVGDPVAQAPAGEFLFETDATGTICWVEGVARGALVGLSVAGRLQDAEHQVDGSVAGAFRGRAAFRDARLTIAGLSDAAGSWRISGVPLFDDATGRFTGYRGSARRPRVDETTQPRRGGDVAASEALRRLVHELRTPTNAIAGFSELIETELMGPVPETYRARAATIRTQAADLIAAIDDLDVAARIEGEALDLRSGRVTVAPLLSGIVRDLEPLARLRGCTLLLSAVDGGLAIMGDDRAVERLLARLLSAVTSAGSAGETVTVAVAGQDAMILLQIDRPAALAAIGDDVLLSIDAEGDEAAPGAPLLGTGFALRLARNLASELGGGLTLDDTRLTLRLPAALDDAVGQASTR